MEALVAALSGLGIAVAGLGGVLWKMHQSNGHQQGEGLTLLREMKGMMQRDMDARERDMRERAEFRRETEAAFSGIAKTLAYLEGRRRDP